MSIEHIHMQALQFFFNSQGRFPNDRHDWNIIKQMAEFMISGETPYDPPSSGAGNGPEVRAN